MRNWTKEKTHLKCILVILVWMTFAAGCGMSFRGDSEESGYFTAGEETQETGEKQPETLQAGAKSDEAALVFVHVCGEVKKPGLYSLPAGSRAGDAVEAAGGFDSKADIHRVNLAAILQDGQQLYVPDESEAGDRQAGLSSDDPGDSTGLLAEVEAQESGRSDKININTADLAALISLKGIGESKASAIIEYRREHGAFTAPEDIRSVPGIGDGIYNRIKDLITV